MSEDKDDDNDNDMDDDEDISNLCVYVCEHKQTRNRNWLCETGFLEKTVVWDFSAPKP